MSAARGSRSHKKNIHHVNDLIHFHPEIEVSSPLFYTTETLCRFAMRSKSKHTRSVRLRTKQQMWALCETPWNQHWWQLCWMLNLVPCEWSLPMLISKGLEQVAPPVPYGNNRNCTIVHFRSRVRIKSYHDSCRKMWTRSGGSKNLTRGFHAVCAHKCTVQILRPRPFLQPHSVCGWSQLPRGWTTWHESALSSASSQLYQLFFRVVATYSYWRNLEQGKGVFRLLYNVSVLYTLRGFQWKPTKPLLIRPTWLVVMWPEKLWTLSDPSLVAKEKAWETSGLQVLFLLEQGVLIRTLSCSESSSLAVAFLYFLYRYAYLCAILFIVWIWNVSAWSVTGFRWGVSQTEAWVLFVTLDPCMHRWVCDTWPSRCGL